MISEVFAVGIVRRVSCDTLAFVCSTGSNVEYAITPDLVEGFAGEHFSRLGIDIGTVLKMLVDSATGVVKNVWIAPDERVDPIRANDADLKGAPIPVGEMVAAQLELLPTAAPKRAISVRRGLPVETRQFGRVLDCDQFRPGDLMLSRYIQQDRVSSTIVNVQEIGGYASPDARWTHAAMYVGDGNSVVEATFDTIFDGSVRLTSLDEYCNGKQALRFRRPKLITNDRDGWRLCVRALARINAPYDFLAALRMWYHVRVRGQILARSLELRDCPPATVCSTLYADAYTEATGFRLGEVLGCCVPAWLSVSDTFDDLDAQWLQIE